MADNNSMYFAVFSLLFCALVVYDMRLVLDVGP